MGCCQQMPVKEKLQQFEAGQILFQEEISPKTLQMQPLSLNLIKGDIDSIDNVEKVERLGSTCVDNILNEKQPSRMEKEENVELKEDVFINLRQTQNLLQLAQDSSSRNLNKKFLGML
ncbi:unnamed protein product (macronuclear) [Paramecium tetraurelia]|uniref:Uncharacterized protein n=1 Tax=Paramecium tetraurelia TaxID=5888 RepID=A0DN36_PARTE|nr:uncharacterized protein GSPATT00018658001 [Paramecium tetraurelia]CAK84453.1 unnamed protein product [Paramecium tetraurelia]|eukprot:XP_001451850.1 hypothetical protein (macronuclear) [Paramecium tetraurelia strain d4-2]